MEDMKMNDERRAHVGMMVVVRDRTENGTSEHPAVINRCWNNQPLGDRNTYTCVNLTVFPDCAQPYSLTSVYIYAHDEGQYRSCWPAQ